MTNKCHFIGIGGIGMSGLARILLDRDVSVSGSDLSTNSQTQFLASRGATIHHGHIAEHVPEGATVVYTTGVTPENPEFAIAEKSQCRLLHRSDLLHELTEGYKTLAVTGTHGKTTTSALLTWVLTEGGWDPAFAVGGVVRNLDTNAAHGNGKYFVAEADESDGTFLKYFPHAAIVTNIGLDHMPTFETEEALIQAFQEFCGRTDFLFWCGDDNRLQKINPSGLSYGFEEENILRISNYRQEGWKIRFDVTYETKHYPDIEVMLTGKHNARNATAVFALALSLGLPEEAIRKAFSSFEGIGRRSEKVAEKQSILVLDDYAHHTTEIQTTLRAIREAVGERRIIAVFQSHRYTRTRDCMGMYKDAFHDADELIVTDIYPAGEKPMEGISHESILKEATGIYIPKEELADRIFTMLRPHDVVVTLGAGDITKVSGQIAQKLEEQKIQKYKVGVIAGGRSAEHEISHLSAKHFQDSLNEEFYDLEMHSIPKRGEMVSLELIQKLMECDVLIPVLHGPYGEDGTIQGLFEMLDKPYVGPDFRSASVCMDKSLTKKIMLASGIPTAPFVPFSSHDWQRCPDEIIDAIKSALQFPVFIKGSHLGSSIGLQKVEEASELSAAIDACFCFDTHVIAEQGIVGREIEFAVLGNEKVITFPPGEILTDGEVYDYESKYGENGFPTAIQADLSDPLIHEGMILAKRAYLAVGCTGMARVDFFLDEENQFWLNELNPIPGFTKISLYPSICRVNGLDSGQLMDELLILALARQRRNRCFSYFPGSE